MKLLLLVCLLSVSNVFGRISSDNESVSHESREPPIGSLNQDDFSAEALMAHNLYRRIHGVPALHVNAKLNDLALKRATELAQSGKLNVKQIMFKGQNLGETVGTVGGFSSYNGISATQLWYSVVSKFDEEGESSNEGASFTQMVWKKTEQVGFGIAKSRDGKFFFVAEYFPSGNIRGQYEDNVFQLTEDNESSKCVNQSVVEMWKKLVNSKSGSVESVLTTTTEEPVVEETTTRHTRPTVIKSTTTEQPEVEETTSTRRTQATTTTIESTTVASRRTTTTPRSETIISKPTRPTEEADEEVETTTRRRMTTTHSPIDAELERTTRRSKFTTPSPDSMITLDPSELPETTTTTERTTTTRRTTTTTTEEPSTTTRRSTTTTTEEPTTVRPRSTTTTTTTVETTTVHPRGKEDDDVDHDHHDMTTTRRSVTTTTAGEDVVVTKPKGRIVLDEEPTGVEESKMKASKTKLFEQATQSERVPVTKPKRIIDQE